MTREPYQEKVAAASELPLPLAEQMIRRARARQVRLMNVATAEIERVDQCTAEG